MHEREHAKTRASITDGQGGDSQQISNIPELSDVSKKFIRGTQTRTVPVAVRVAATPCISSTPEAFFFYL